MTSYTRVNINTAHLIPTAAVWRSPEIIKTLVNSLFKLSFLFLLFALTGYTLSQTTMFNETRRLAYAKYRMCLSNFVLTNAEYTNSEMFYANERCYAQAEQFRVRRESR